MEVEIDDGPEHISDPGAVILFRFEEPLSILDEHRGTERWPICENSIKSLRRSMAQANYSPAVGDPGR